MKCQISGCEKWGCEKVVRNDRTYKYKYCEQHLKEHYSGTSKKGKEAKRLALGNRWRTKQGYIFIRNELGQAVSEHKVILERKLGRLMLKGESVHHKNGIRDDNRPENLELWLYGFRYGQRARDIICPHCGKPYNDET